MAIGLIKGASSVFIKEESTEGVYAPPTLASDALEVMSDGISFEYSRAEIERKVLTSTIEVVASRIGLPEVKGTIPVEYKASSTVGSAPKSDVLLKSLLGGKHSVATQITSLTGHTTTNIFLSAPNLALLKKGQVVKVLKAGAHELRPIKSIEVDHIVLAIPLSSTPPDAVILEKATTYFYQENAPTFSATHYIGGEIEEKVTGLRSLNASVEKWETATTPELKFSVAGLGLTREVNAPVYTPDFSADALPPVLLGACVFLDQVKVPYSKLALHLENQKADIKSVCSSTGKLGSRFTEFKVMGEINPYMDSANVDRFDSFNLNNDVSVFGYAYNPTDVAGEFKESVSFWIPQAKITSMPVGNENDIMTDMISFKSYRKDGGDSVFLTFI
jgi:hypothetical protein